MSTPVELTLRMSSRGRVSPNGDVDRARFEALVADHGAALLRLATRLTASRADAEDLAQETLLRAWRGLRSFRGEARLRTWLFRILRNVWLDRKPALRPLGGAELPSPAETSPARTLARREAVGRILDGVRELPPRQRECLVLRVRGGLTYEEIAGVMGIRKGAVKSHLVHARRKLLRRFGPELRDWGIA